MEVQRLMFKEGKIDKIKIPILWFRNFNSIEAIPQK